MPRILTKPTVAVVAATQFRDHAAFPIPADGTDAERLGAFAAKGCYGSHGADGRPNRENQRQCLAQGHGSVFEHAFITLFITGVSRGLSHEMVRHRAGTGVSQRSTRYTDEGDSAIVLDPTLAAVWERYADDCAFDEDGHPQWPGIAFPPPELVAVAEHVHGQIDALAAYEQNAQTLLAWNPQRLTGAALRKWARGKARNLLPHGLETHLTFTGNWRAWRHFITLRTAEGAEAEIRRLAYAIYTTIQPFAPTYFEDFVETPGADGIPVLSAPKV